ncbi:hypothetical protein DL98DRAFT_578537 [Cadophora sp. DSE1049]|nr:hypothetical protein DL98DRAFT_578537 [Cadophora sp. DSE1049]
MPLDTVLQNFDANKTINPHTDTSTKVQVSTRELEKLKDQTTGSNHVEGRTRQYYGRNREQLGQWRELIQDNGELIENGNQESNRSKKSTRIENKDRGVVKEGTSGHTTNLEVWSSLYAIYDYFIPRFVPGVLGSSREGTLISAIIHSAAMLHREESHQGPVASRDSRRSQQGRTASALVPKPYCQNLSIQVLGSQDRIRTELHGQKGGRYSCIVDALLRKESHQGLSDTGWFMQSGLENQLGRIKQRWRFMSRPSGAMRFMQKMVEDQLG